MVTRDHATRRCCCGNSPASASPPTTTAAPRPLHLPNAAPPGRRRKRSTRRRRKRVCSVKAEPRRIGAAHVRQHGLRCAPYFNASPAPASPSTARSSAASTARGCAYLWASPTPTTPGSPSGWRPRFTSCGAARRALGGGHRCAAPGDQSVHVVRRRAQGPSPTWNAAAGGETAEPLVDHLVATLRGRGAQVETGRFGPTCRSLSSTTVP